ncbi:hypothetical protein MIR68_000497 [Amoeboaphelidium protococcarum]|nr:hypothetical protein MIR68_000497 [Amoeboaphelidium protococcarum]
MGGKRRGHRKEIFNEGELESSLQKNGLRLQQIKGDGNCLFRALSDQLHGSEDRHVEFRQMVCDYIDKHRDEFVPFLLEEDDGNTDIEEYVAKMRQNGTYGGNIELVAFSRLISAEIWIYQNERVYQISSAGASSKILRIAYHSYEHYSSVHTLNPATDLLNQRHGQQHLYEPTLDSDKLKSLVKVVVSSVTQVSDNGDEDTIKNLLKQHNYDVDKVIETLLTESADIEQVLEVEASVVEESAPGESKSPRRPAKLTKRDKKKARKQRKQQSTAQEHSSSTQTRQIEDTMQRLQI